MDQIGVRSGLAPTRPSRPYDRTLRCSLDLLYRHRHLHVIEVFNQGERCPQDWQRWDLLLTEMCRASDLYLLRGSSVDDLHQAAQVGRNDHVYLLPERTEATLREAMVADVAPDRPTAQVGRAAPH